MAHLAEIARPADGYIIVLIRPDFGLTSYSLGLATAHRYRTLVNFRNKAIIYSQQIYVSKSQLVETVR